MIALQIFLALSAKWELPKIQKWEKFLKKVFSFLPEEENRDIYIHIFQLTESEIETLYKYTEKEDVAIRKGTLSCSFFIDSMLQNATIKKIRKERGVSEETAKSYYYYYERYPRNAAFLETQLTSTEWKRIEKWVEKDRVFSVVRNGDFWLCITRAKEMNFEVPKTNNFTRWAYEINESHQLYEAKIQEEKILENYKKTSVLWEFEDENYLIKTPKCSNDLIKEGEDMHNCVGRCYLNDVVDNHTYICFIRKKESPDKSCITCEVTKTGKIQQFLGFRNSNVLSPELEQFRGKFQEYIYKKIEEYEISL